MKFDRTILIRREIKSYLEGEIGLRQLILRMLKTKRDYKKNGVHSNNKKLIRTDYRGTRLFVKPQQEVHKQIFYGYFETHIVDLIDQFVRHGDICLDVGANIGFYSCRLANLVGDEGKVLSFEPVNYNRKLLNLNVRANGLRNLEIFEFGLGAKNETLEMKVFPEDDFLIGHNSFVDNETILANARYDVEKIEVRSIDDVLEQGKIAKVDFVKVDIEGYEYHFFKGAKNLLENIRPTIIFEHSPDRLSLLGIDENEFVGFFRNYDVYQIHLGGLEPYDFDGKCTAPDLIAFPK